MPTPSIAYVTGERPTWRPAAMSASESSSVPKYTYASVFGKQPTKEAAAYVRTGTSESPSAYELSGDGMKGRRRRQTISLNGSCSSAPITSSSIVSRRRRPKRAK